MVFGRVDNCYDFKYNQCLMGRKASRKFLKSGNGGTEFATYRSIAFLFAVAGTVL